LMNVKAWTKLSDLARTVIMCAAPGSRG